MAEASALPDWHPSQLSVIGEDTDHQLLFCKSTSGADYVVKYTYDENELRICEEYHSRSLQSPFLVQCPGKFRSHGIHGLVFDSSQNRNLGYMLRSRKNSSVSWSFRLCLARDICKKFIFLESQQIKSKIGRSNVFFTDDFCVQFLLSEFDDIVPNYVQAFSSLLEKILSGWQSVKGGRYANVAVREESRMPQERDLSVDDKDILEVLKRVRQSCLRDGKTLKDVKKMLDPAWNDERKDNAWQDVLRLKLESGPSDTGTPLMEYEPTKIKDERNYESRTDVKSIIRSHSESDQKALLAMPVSRNIIISKEFEFSNEYRSRLQDEGRNMLQDVGQNVLQDEDPDSLQDERTNRLQDVGQNVLQDEDPDRLQDERTNRLQDVGQNVLQDEDPDRLQDVDPNRLQDVDPNRLQDEDPNRLQDVDPNRLQDEDSNRLQDVDPNRLQDEDPNRLQDEAPNRLQDEDPNSFQDEDPDRESQCERILSTVVIFIGAVLGALIGAVIGALIGDMFEALMKMACPYVGGFIGASVGVKAGAREGSAIVKSLLQSFRPKQLLGIILVVIIAFNRWPSKDIVNKLRGETESKLANVISTGMNDGLPDILPTLREVPIYDGHSVGFDVTLPHIFTVKGKKIRHVMVVGAAGSGKTTLLAKFAKLSLEGKIDLMAQIQSVVYIPFMDFNSKEHFTFEQLLAEMYYPNHHKKKDEIFEHLNDNQEKVLFVFDGYDQSGLSIIETTCQSISVTTKASLSTVFCNLFKGHLFPKSYLLTSSREYAVLELPMVARPSKTILLNGFSYPHLDVMMNLTNVGKKTMLQHVKNHPSDLRELCRSPMFFHFVRYMLESDPKSEMVYSFTGVIKHTFTRFVRSEHIRNGREVDSVLQKLEKLAYIGSMENRVKFNDKDLAACGLNNNRLIFDLQIRIKNGPYYHLFNGTTDYLFIHQTIQEYLSALHIVRSVPIYQFNSTVTMQLMKNGNWAVLRKFVTGILMNEKVSSG
uniref:uncharacterized protein LOC100187264 isoform X3 n=1 Tax=Ciona intestinalis TaxID=7719 RepID=UPI000EF55953|nr:uncharacterized protein LOC100187264 isoform X3 [Ciona intestinalis]|eukprot:XP_026693655.1 uncharacterized protein LOC100187264 isoform X3 [Ciona intestinalis]